LGGVVVVVVVMVVEASFCFRVVSARLVLFVVGAVLPLEGLVGTLLAVFVLLRGKEGWNNTLNQNHN